MSISSLHGLSNRQAYRVLEQARWGDDPQCPYCENTKVWRHHDEDRSSPRWQCGGCQKSFCATVGTIFHRTHVPLRVWYLAAAIIITGSDMSVAQFAKYSGINRRATISRIFGKLRPSLLVGDGHSVLIERILNGFGVPDHQMRAAA